MRRFLLITGLMITLILAACSANTSSGSNNDLGIKDAEAKSASFETPPQPNKPIIPDYPAEARQNGIQGKVILEVEVLKTGKIGKISVKQSVNGLNEAAVEAVQKADFSPATHSGKAVDSLVLIPVEFKLQ